MLLNISNHPISSWSDKQTEAAKILYGSIQDLPFPHINPTYNEEEIKVIANDYYNRINSIQPQAIHLMGELTFCFCLLMLLKNKGYKVIASTTTRNISYSETGEKISKFEFVRFREYL